MDTSNLYINDFVDKLCRHRYDVHGTDLAKESLLDLRDNLPGEQFRELVLFDKTVRDFEEMSDTDDLDIETPKARETTEKYENLIDKSNIYPENKAALYNTLLNHIEKYNGGNTWFMSVLRKKSAVLAQGDDTELNMSAKQAFFHRRNVKPAEYLNLMHQLYAKMNDKERFTFLNELGLSLDKRRKKIASATRMSTEQRSRRLAIIRSIISEPLPIKMRVDLLEEALTLANNNNKIRSNNFELKRDICRELSHYYQATGNTQKAKQYGDDIGKWQRSITLAMDYGNMRHRGEKSID
jgi:hypothetical protein